MMLFPLWLAIHAADGDPELVQRLQRRDPQALAELYDRYGRIVFSLILRIVRDGGTAEDLVQETFLRVWNRVQGFDAEKGSIAPWLLAVARNRAIDYLRSVAGRERNALEFEETDHPALYVDMEHDILTSDKARVIKGALEKLNVNQRQVIELAYFEGLSQSEMAERMGQPLGTVKTWVRTALKNLRDELGRGGGVGMNHEELRDQYEMYALGVAEEPERGEIREHLNRGCEVCMAEVKRARQLAAFLGGAALPAAPSPKLRRRILASVGFEQKRFGFAPFLAAALALSLFAVFYFSGRERDFAQLATRLDGQLRTQTIELTRLHEAFAILNGPETKVTSFGAGPKGKVFVSPSQGVLLIATNLPPTPAGKAYEMWVIPNGGKGTPIPAGVFQSSSDGTAMHIQRGPIDMASQPVIAVTVEPEAGSAAPTSTPLFAAGVQ